LLYPTPISQLPEYEACEQAVPYYQEAVRRAPDYDPDWWYEHGYCLRHFKRDAEVVEVYERAVHFFPTESPLAAVEQYQLLKAVDPRRADELFRN